MVILSAAHISNRGYKQLQYNELFFLTAESQVVATQRLWAELLLHSYPVMNYTSADHNSPQNYSAYHRPLSHIYSFVHSARRQQAVSSGVHRFVHAASSHVSTGLLACGGAAAAGLLRGRSAYRMLAWHRGKYSF